MKLKIVVGLCTLLLILLAGCVVNKEGSYFDFEEKVIKGEVVCAEFSDEQLEHDIGVAIRDYRRFLKSMNWDKDWICQKQTSGNYECSKCLDWKENEN